MCVWERESVYRMHHTHTHIHTHAYPRIVFFKQQMYALYMTRPIIHVCVCEGSICVYVCMCVCVYVCMCVCVYVCMTHTPNIWCIYNTPVTHIPQNLVVQTALDVLQCVAVCCSVLQWHTYMCVAVCCSVLQWHTYIHTPQNSLLQKHQMCCSVLQCVADCCNGTHIHDAHPRILFFKQ